MNRRHETSDMDPKYVVYFAAGLVVVGILVYIALWWMFHQFEQQQARRENQPTLVKAPKPEPQPKLQISPQGDLEEFLTKENEVLTTYGWIDREKGTARIPIDRAMQLLLEKEKK
jgi:hypothetical protein